MSSRVARIAALVAMLLAACQEVDRGRSEIQNPDPEGSGSDAAGPAFPATIEGESCCVRFCRELVGAGCTDLGTTEEACVAAACPTPSGLPDAGRGACLLALGDALCCAWRVGGAECTGVPDPHGISECASLAVEADTECTPP